MVVCQIQSWADAQITTAPADHKWPSINHELAAKFREWYPDFEIDETHDVADAA